VAITSCAKHADRRAAVRETWLQHVTDADVRFFVGRDGASGSGSHADDCIVLDCPDDYASLPQKTYRLVEYALSRGYTTLIKIDDDTLFNPRYVSEFVKHDCLAWIRDGVRNDGIPYPQGACYSLSERAMRAVLAHPELFTKGIEDGAVGKALRLESVSLTHTRRIRPHKYAGDISRHGFSPEQMKRVHCGVHRGCFFACR
jgi:hypothetical protein